MNAPAEFSRLLPLEGGFNLRDMGGYATEDGRTVKYGTLYRSGVMSLLTEADEAHLAGLGIATVCDLRRGNERRARPTRWCEPAGVDYLARDYRESSGVLADVLRGSVSTRAEVRAAMIQIYKDIPHDHQPSYRTMFERLLAGRVPLLFNCTAGKDRTGVGAALILTVLGVPRDTIVEDYLLTNAHTDFRRLMSRTDDELGLASKFGADVVEPLLLADVDYLDTAFATIDSRHGGLDAYLAELGVDEEAKAKLRDQLLD